MLFCFFFPVCHLTFDDMLFSYGDFCAFLLLTEILVYSNSKFANCMIHKNGGEKYK